MPKIDPIGEHPDIKRVKDRATELQLAASPLTRSQCIELAAREMGYGTYAALRTVIKNHEEL